MNTGALLAYTNLTYNGTELVDADNNKIQPYKTLYEGTFGNGKKYNVKGIYLQYNSTKELLPRSANDIVEVLDPTITASDIDIACDATAGEIAFTVNNPVTGGELTAACTDAWISNVAVGTDKVTFDTEANTATTERTATITLTYTYNTTETVVKNVTVTQAKYVAPDVNVDPAQAGVGCFVKVTSTADITAGNYLIVYEGDDTHASVAFNGGLQTLDAANNGINVAIVDGKILATTATVAATFIIQPSGSIKSASGKYIGKAANANGLDIDDSALANTLEIDADGNAVITAEGGCTLKYNYNSDQLRFRYYKSGQHDIALYKYDENATSTVDVTISAAGYATYCSTGALDFSSTGLTVYKAKIEGTEVKFQEVTKVPAGEGVLLQGTAGTYNIPVIATADPIDNDFIGVLTATDVAAGIYVLMNGEKDGNKGVGFYKTTKTFTVSAHTAYLPALANSTRDFIWFGEDSTTGIEQMVNGKSVNGKYYNLQGQRVNQPTKGMYIVNGKKVVVK